MYTKQYMYVKWNNSLSSAFDVENGVRQGAVLSPILFCVYMDQMLNDLEMSGYGCKIGNLYCGAFAYADDVILLSPTVCGLQKMVNISCQFARRHNVKFHPTKSKLVMFYKNIKPNIL